MANVLYHPSSDLVFSVGIVAANLFSHGSIRECEPHQPSHWRSFLVLPEVVTSGTLRRRRTRCLLLLVVAFTEGSAERKNPCHRQVELFDAESPNKEANATGVGVA